MQCRLLHAASSKGSVHFVCDVARLFSVRILPLCQAPLSLWLGLVVRGFEALVFVEANQRQADFGLREFSL